MGARNRRRRGGGVQVQVLEAAPPAPQVRHGPAAAEAPLRLEPAQEIAPLRLEAPVEAPLRLTEVVALPIRPPAAFHAPQRPLVDAAPGTGDGDAADAPWSGARLRRAREARGVCPAALAGRLKVTASTIDDLEAERRERLPPPYYLRALLLALAKELRLDGAAVVRSYPGAAKVDPSLR
jgi:hypothetical protein